MASIAVNAKGKGTLLSDQLRISPPASTATPRSQVWRQQRSGRSYTALWVVYLMQGTSHSIALGNRSAREGVTVVTEEESPTSGP